MPDDDPTGSPLMHDIDRRLDSLEDFRSVSFEFAWDTPNIATGVDTGLVVPAGKQLPYASDMWRVLEEVTGSPTGTIMLFLGSGPDIGTLNSPGVDLVVQTQANGPPLAADITFSTTPGNDAIMSGVNAGTLGSSGNLYVNPAKDWHVWVTMQVYNSGDGDPVLTGGRLAWALT